MKRKTSLKKKKTIFNLMLSHLTSLLESNTIVDADSSFLTTARMMDMSLLKILIIFPRPKIAEKGSCVTMSF